YLAQHVRIKRRCAIKVLRAALTDDDDSLQRFQREAENASMISHPNVAQVYDFGEHGNLLYLAMEFIEGQSMQQIMEKDGVMHPDMVADVIMQSASALDAAHAQQVLHRDVKPDNIMLARNTDGTYLVKLVDFGIARAMASTDKRVTQTGMVVGTPEFMSPEQIAGEPLDARSDLYSLALVAFIALTGTGAFPDSGSMESLILRLTSRPRTLLEARQGVSWPPKLQTVFDRALAPQREERQNTTVEFATQLSDSIIQMSPSETSAFYRRALEARAVNPVALTPSATPVKPSKGNKRDKTEAAAAVKPPPSEYRPASMVGRPTQVAYNGPAMRKNRTWNVFVGLVVLGGIYVVATHQTDAVLEKVSVWWQPVQTFFKSGMDGVKNSKATDSTPAVVEPAIKPPTRTKPKAAAKLDSLKKKDSTTTPKSTTPPTDTTSTYGL
ncbi:MAG: serine/threonine-protein kinase, partial [Gemmatimonadaceae bacterium]